MTMNDRRTRNLFKIVLAQLLVGFIMFALGLTIVFIAQGYRMNLKNFKIIKTGIIYLTSETKSADVLINGKLVSRKLPFSDNFSPGYYTVEVRKADTVNWSVTAKVEPELVTSYKNITFFRKNIFTDDLSDERKIAQITGPDETLATGPERNLSNTSHEIWLNDKLVARLSLPIYRAIWYNDGEYSHIVYQQGDQIRIIEKNGSNDTQLVKLNQDSPVNFATGNRGTELYYSDNGKYKVAYLK